MAKQKGKRLTFAGASKLQQRANGQKLQPPPQGVPQTIFGEAAPVKKERSREEQDLQIDAMAKFKSFYPRYAGLFIHIVNQATADNKIIGGILKAMGRQAGVWDCILFVKRHGYDGLWVEFKRDYKYAGLSEEQELWQKEITETGGYNFKWVMVKRLEDFLRAVEDYLNEGRITF